MIDSKLRVRRVVHCTVQTGDWDWFTEVVASCFLKRLQGFLAAHCTGERRPKSTEHQQREPGDL